MPRQVKEKFENLFGILFFPFVSKLVCKVTEVRLLLRPEKDISSKKAEMLTATHSSEPVIWSRGRFHPQCCETSIRLLLRLLLCGAVPMWLLCIVPWANQFHMSHLQCPHCSSGSNRAWFSHPHTANKNSKQTKRQLSVTVLWNALGLKHSHCTDWEFASRFLSCHYQ